MPAAADRQRLLSLRLNDVARSVTPVRRCGQNDGERIEEGDRKVGRREVRDDEIWSNMADCLAKWLE